MRSRFHLILCKVFLVWAELSEWLFLKWANLKIPLGQTDEYKYKKRFSESSRLPYNGPEYNRFFELDNIDWPKGEKRDMIHHGTTWSISPDEQNSLPTEQPASTGARTLKQWWLEVIHPASWALEWLKHWKIWCQHSPVTIYLSCRIRIRLSWRFLKARYSPRDLNYGFEQSWAVVLRCLAYD